MASYVVIYATDTLDPDCISVWPHSFVQRTTCGNRELLSRMAVKIDSVFVIQLIGLVLSFHFQVQTTEAEEGKDTVCWCIVSVVGAGCSYVLYSVYSAR